MYFYVRSNFKMFFVWLSLKCEKRRKCSFLFQLRVLHLFFYNVKKKNYVFRCINKNNFIKETLKKLKCILQVLGKKYYFIFTWVQVWLCSSYWPQTHDFSASVFWVLELLAWPSMFPSTNILLHLKLWIITY